MTVCALHSWKMHSEHLMCALLQWRSSIEPYGTLGTRRYFRSPLERLAGPPAHHPQSSSQHRCSQWPCWEWLLRRQWTGPSACHLHSNYQCCRQLAILRVAGGTVGRRTCPLPSEQYPCGMTGTNCSDTLIGGRLQDGSGWWSDWCVLGPWPLQGSPSLWIHLKCNCNPLPVSQ